MNRWSLGIIKGIDKDDGARFASGLNYNSNDAFFPDVLPVIRT